MTSCNLPRAGVLRRRRRQIPVEPGNNREFSPPRRPDVKFINKQASGGEKSGRHGKCLDAELLETVRMLAQDEPLSRRYFDHPPAASGATTAIATSDPTSF
ncbi:MAG TPA: hypothetical protein VGI28_17140 [Stellaceae bacterium]